MGIDIRATVTCSLGTLISANVSDDYIQGSGLIKSRGSCEIRGLISPAVGQVVTFNYTKSGVTRNVPRKLRVLSSFADPFRRTTKVELGCKLTYLADLKDPIKWDALNDPLNSDITEAETQIVTFPIHASSIANECLRALGITASSNPLTNKFSIPEFDFGTGYVQTLSDLLVSESFVGYLDFTERLQIINLASLSSSGPSFGTSRLIDVGPIGVGDLAGDAVTVSYSTLKLKIPDDTEVAQRDDTDPAPTPTPIASGFTGWNTAVSRTRNTSSVVIPYEDQAGISRFATYAIANDVTEETQYRNITVKTENGNEQRNVVNQRTLVESNSAAAVAGGVVTQYLSNGFAFGNFNVASRTIEKFSYDVKGNEIFRSLTRTGDALLGIGALSAPFVIENEQGTPAVVPLPSGTITLERTTVDTYINGNYRQTVTRRFGPWINSLSGQQSIAEGRFSFTSATAVTSFLNTALGGEYLLDVTVSTERSASGAGSQQAPAAEDINNEALADPTTADPDNGFRTESVAEIELATGSASATRRIELSMPFASDDTFIRRTETIEPLTFTYRSVSSDARPKAKRFGLTQNRLLFGNRNGMNIQVPPEVLPNEPFGAFYLSANGAVTQYRTNGTSWTMDSNGIVSSTDALYWGVAGKTA
jgi:hypothetical protein